MYLDYTKIKFDSMGRPEVARPASANHERNIHWVPGQCGGPKIDHQVFGAK